jgi:hypothetical protein
MGLPHCSQRMTLRNGSAPQITQTHDPKLFWGHSFARYRALNAGRNASPRRAVLLGCKTMGKRRFLQEAAMSGKVRSSPLRQPGNAQLRQASPRQANLDPVLPRSASPLPRQERGSPALHDVGRGAT